jgi:hypothetical protein
MKKLKKLPKPNRGPENHSNNNNNNNNKNKNNCNDEFVLEGCSGMNNKVNITVPTCGMARIFHFLAYRQMCRICGNVLYTSKNEHL